MKVSAIQLIAFCGLAALAAQPIMAQEVTTCDVECVGPYNACSWEAIYSSDQSGNEKACRDANDKCIKDCVAKNGKVKYVYKPSPHPEAVDTPKPATTKKPVKTKTAKPTSNLRFENLSK